jgi:hypothetical protein
VANYRCIGTDDTATTQHRRLHDLWRESEWIGREDGVQRGGLRGIVGGRVAGCLCGNNCCVKKVREW